jgi:hypothetical protein
MRTPGTTADGSLTCRMKENTRPYKKLAKFTSGRHEILTAVRPNIVNVNTKLLRSRLQRAIHPSEAASRMDQKSYLVRTD